ncbi:MAG: hypothetical protein CL678_15105 [Bdellovibrionaceae bacterium]|nr:hypothetical protein [Pseudobdellovibrionaceae bacterium]|tara:strand:+ start:4498 stop:4797 length:300 start_codon:yes stop_codon:yes gene_type:complete
MATLRILGFRTSEVFQILISEVLFLMLAFIPIGCILGYFNARWLIAKMSMDAFQIPFIIEPMTYFYSSLVLVVSVLVSSWLIYYRVKKIDLIATLKSRG